MGMRIDAARHHVAAAGVDDLDPGGRVEGDANRGNGLAVDEDVGPSGMIVVDDGAAADQKGHDMLRTESLLSRPHPASINEVYRAIRTWTGKNVVRRCLENGLRRTGQIDNEPAKECHGHSVRDLTPAV